MMRGIAVPTTVWSTAESSMPSITATITAAMRLRLSVSPQGWGAAAAAESPAAAVRTSATARLVAVAGGLRSGVFGRRRLGDPEQTAEAAQQALELVRAESAEPALDVLLAALAQRGGELDGGRREGHQRATAVPRVTLAHGEAVLLELVDQQASARLAEAEMAAQRAHGLRAEHGDRHQGLELAHGEVERQPVGATCAGDHRKHPAGGLVAVLDEPGVWGGLGQRVLRPPEDPLPKPTPHASLVQDCHEAARRVLAMITRASGPDWLSLDLTMGQFTALMTVTLFGPQPVGALGRHLGLSEPGACLLVDKLEEHGLAVR